MFLLHNIFIQCFVLTMILESELSAWSLKVSSYRQNHTVILFLIWICYQTVIHL